MKGQIDDVCEKAPQATDNLVILPQPQLAFL